MIGDGTLKLLLLPLCVAGTIIIVLLAIPILKRPPNPHQKDNITFTTNPEMGGQSSSQTSDTLQKPLERPLPEDWELIEYILSQSNQCLQLKDIIYAICQKARVKAIEPVVRLPHLLSFLEAVVHLETRSREPYKGWDIAFHATPGKNVPSIIRNGFKVPGTGHISRFLGSYGDGIYCSPSPTYCYPYGHTWDRELNILDPQIGVVAIFVCAVVRGKPYQCNWGELDHASGSKEGFDSHESKESGGSEWVLFDANRIVPLCLLWVKCDHCGTQRNFFEWTSWTKHETIQPGVGKELKEDISAMKKQGSREYDFEHYREEMGCNGQRVVGRLWNKISNILSARVPISER